MSELCWCNARLFGFIIHFGGLLGSPLCFTCRYYIGYYWAVLLHWTKYVSKLVVDILGFCCFDMRKYELY